MGLGQSLRATDRQTNMFRTILSRAVTCVLDTSADVDANVDGGARLDGPVVELGLGLEQEAGVIVGGLGCRVVQRPVSDQLRHALLQSVDVEALRGLLRARPRIPWRRIAGLCGDAVVPVYRALQSTLGEDVEHLAALFAEMEMEMEAAADAGALDEVGRGAVSSDVSNRTVMMTLAIGARKRSRARIECVGRTGGGGRGSRTRHSTYYRECSFLSRRARCAGLTEAASRRRTRTRTRRHRATIIGRQVARTCRGS